MSSNPLVSSGSPPRGGHSRSSSLSSSASTYRSSMPRHRHRRGGGGRRILAGVRKLERMICTTAKHFPLAIVYGGQTWAVYTQAWSICLVHMGGMKGSVLGSLGFVLYGLAVWSYTTAVFRDPGSPFSNQASYSHLPTSEPSPSTGSITVKSSGTPRFCKKCQTRKPDRAHHCATCNRCVLKMDHHCPWLATCLGLYNYKPFLLFLIYTSLLCILAFLVSASWVWSTVLNDASSDLTPGSEITPVNWILMATVSGIIGLVLSGFTVWHVLLAASGMTTIESLEKVRYSAPGLSPHTNPFMHPGNGVDHWTTPASDAAERQRDTARYNAYLDEEALGKLPHAFDLGKTQNLLDVFGTRRWAWLLPVPMSRAEKSRLDGWRWETSRAWADGVARLERERETRALQQQEQWTPPHPPTHGGSGGGAGITGGTFETRHYPPPRPGTQHRLEARSAGETPVGMVKPPTPGHGLRAMESRIRNDWAFLDEDPQYTHATTASGANSSSSSSSSSTTSARGAGAHAGDSDFDDSDGEDPPEGPGGGGDPGARGLMEHLKLRGGKARKRERDFYHREVFGGASGGGGNRGGRKNLAEMMGAIPHHQPRGGQPRSKVDRVLGRSMYDTDERGGAGPGAGAAGGGHGGEAVKMKRLRGRVVPLMVAAGRRMPEAEAEAGEGKGGVGVLGGGDCGEGGEGGGGGGGSGDGGWGGGEGAGAGWGG